MYKGWYQNGKTQKFGWGELRYTSEDVKGEVIVVRKQYHNNMYRRDIAGSDITMKTQKIRKITSIYQQ